MEKPDGGIKGGKKRGGKKKKQKKEKKKKRGKNDYAGSKLELAGKLQFDTVMLEIQGGNIRKWKNPMEG